MLEFVRSETHPKNIFFINAQTLKDKVDLGALLSRYSRSDKDAEALYKEEFVTNNERGKEFYSKVFGQYGDESISELVPLGFAVCLENVPILWTTYILHYRTLSAIEKSTRYVKALDYYKPNQKTNAIETFNQRSKQQIEDYNLEIKRTESRLIKELKITNLTNKALLRALRVRALDECRSMLPLSTFTSIGIMSNLRSWLNILTKEKVRNESSLYVSDLIDPLMNLFKDNFPSIFSQDKIDYLVKSENIIYPSKLELQIIEDDEFVAPHVNKVDNFELIYTPDIGPTMDYLPYIEQVDRIKKIKPVREYEMLDFTITIPNVDVATFRDIQRHRYFTIIINRWNNSQSEEQELVLLSSPMSNTMDITIKGNLRQWTHAIELRTQEQGHFKYRQIFQQCGSMIAKDLNIEKKQLFPYADWRTDKEIGLGRLKSEMKKMNYGI